MTASGSAGNGTKLARWPILVILLVAAALRLAACGKYPYVDEVSVMGSITNFFTNKTLAPTDFSYPTGYTIPAAVASGIGAAVLWLVKFIPSPTAFSSLGEFNSVAWVFPARLISVAAGLATIFLAYKIGDRLWGRSVGLWAAAILAISKLHVEYSSYALPDATMAFYATAALWYCLVGLEKKDVRSFVLAGLFAGFTVSTKYNGAPIIVAVIAAHLLAAHAEKKEGGRAAWLGGRIWAAALACIVGFFVATPSWINRSHDYIDWARFHLVHMSVGHMGSFGTPVVTHVGVFWGWDTLGALLYGLGILYGLTRRDRANWVLMALVIPALITYFRIQKIDAHYALYTVPAFALLASRLIVELSSVRALKLVPRAACLVLVWPTLVSATYAFTELGRDSRWAAYDWIQANVPEGASIAIDDGYMPKLPTPFNKAGWAKAKNAKFFAQRLGSDKTYDVFSDAIPVLRHGDLLEAPDMLMSIRDKATPLSAYLHDHLSLRAASQLAIYQGDVPVPDDLEAALIKDIDAELHDPNLYSKERFAGLDLPTEIKEMAVAEPKGEVLVKENRRLLEAAYHDFYRSTMKYNPMPGTISPERLVTLPADWLVVSSGQYERYLTTPRPPETSPLYDDHVMYETTYRALFDDPRSLGWVEAKDFKTGKGPEIRIYHRLEPALR